MLYHVRGLKYHVLKRKDRRLSFNAVARAYDEARPGYPKELVSDVIRISGIPDGGRILEVGCGTGQATLPFAALGYSMLCLDIGSRTVAIARERCKAYPDVAIRCTPFEEWRPERTAFDLLISATAFHWIPPEIGYRKAAAVLTDTGYLALFWNMQPTPNIGFVADEQEVWRRVVPGWRGPEARGDTEASIRKRAAAIRGSGLFEEVQVKRYPWSKVYTTDLYLKLLDSRYRRDDLSDRTRARLYDEIAELSEERYGGRIVKPMLSVLYIAAKTG
jgi:SAM-dependent methyltransferase